MKLGQLVGTIKDQSGLSAAQRETEVSDIAHDSRKVKPGSLFVAVRGFQSDGHRFIPQAVQQGAVAVIAERHEQSTIGAPRIIVKDSREALAILADEFYGHPSRRLSLVGVTGTNGKTTTTYLAKAIIEAAGHTSGLIGTIDYRVGRDVYPAPNTTPESLDLQRFLSEMVRSGASHCVMEVSSHALELGRTLGCAFKVAAFTNLTQDHLDFHGTMDAYFRAKLRLFSGLTPDDHAVINLDDPRSAGIRGATRARMVTFGMTDRAAVHPAGPVGHGIGGLRFTAATPQGTVLVESPLVGRHNIYNILTAIGIGTALGFAPAVIAQGIKAMTSVPGRIEKVEAGQPFGVIVDYAHTEDALDRLLEAIVEIAENRIITVFGCGGDRDRTKRPKMGAAALRGSDVVIVTSDNPRTEDPAGIIAEVETGMGAGLKLPRADAPPSVPGKTPYYVVPERHEAVALAIGLAMPGDVVVLAGKGHEDYQIIGSAKVRFDDREVAREEIKKRQKAGDGGWRTDR